MKLKRTLYVISIFIQINVIISDKYNLFGIPEQGYLIKVRLGRPQQNLNLIVDTGSSTLAVASVAVPHLSAYFHSENSTTLDIVGKSVHALYTQGRWWGVTAADYVEFPTLEGATTLWTDIVLITLDNDFFIKEAGWQGILGLAYFPIEVDDSAQPWLDTLDSAKGLIHSFKLILCGVQNSSDVSHSGTFELLDDNSPHETVMEFKTPILKETWYEVGVLGVHLLSSPMHNTTSQNVTHDREYLPSEETCRLLNAKKSIVDSGTTNFRFPSSIFSTIVDRIKTEALRQNILILDEFLYGGEAYCSEVELHWNLPRLAIDLLDANCDSRYFTLELPPENYIRLVWSNIRSGSVTEFCYKFGLEAHPTDTVLGMTVMEGFQVLFNRSAGFIAWTEGDCGFNVRISGPFILNTSSLEFCGLQKAPRSTVIGSIRIAQWAAITALTLALALLLYLLAPCLRNRLLKSLARRSSHISLSHAAFVNDERT